jgi:AbrB family looped-hinge helix DNA binding protein
MAIVKISPSGQVKIPKKIMQKLNISTGDYVDFEVAHGDVVLKPKKLINADQAWFWTKEWLESEEAAEKDIKARLVSKVFTSAEDGIAYLKKIRKKIQKS